MAQPAFISRKCLLEQLDLYSQFITFTSYKSSYKLSVSLDYLRALKHGYPILMKYCLLTSDLYHETLNNHPEYFV